MGSNEEVDPGRREDINEGGATSESYQSFACHDGGGDMSESLEWERCRGHRPFKVMNYSGAIIVDWSPDHGQF